MPRVLTARFMHETNTFSRVKTDMAWSSRVQATDSKRSATVRKARLWLRPRPLNAA